MRHGGCVQGGGRGHSSITTGTHSPPPPPPPPVDPKWLVALAPRFFKVADPTAGVSRAKKRVKVEPLYAGKHAEPDAWRLTKRRG